MAAQVLRSEVEEPPKISKDETGLPIITGWLSRQVKQGEKFVPRFLKTKDKVLCSFQKDPSAVAPGEEPPRVKNALDMNKIANISSDGANGFTIYLKSEDLDEKDGEHPGYLFRAADEKGAKDWVKTLNAIRVHDPTARKPEGMCCSAFLRC